MTFEERMNKIADIPNQKRIAEQKRLEALEEEAEMLSLQIFDRQKRIRELIALYNKCIECGIEVPKDGADKYGYGCYSDMGFPADGIYHYIGFMTNFCNGQYEVECLGVINGGINGIYDFYTDGYSSYMKYHDEKTYGHGIFMRGDGKDVRCREAFVRDAKKFIDRFDAFEKAFYKFIDSL